MDVHAAVDAILAREQAERDAEDAARAVAAATLLVERQLWGRIRAQPTPEARQAYAEAVQATYLRLIGALT